jgi:predicted metal-dependent phosphoesterase TrpH
VTPPVALHMLAYLFDSADGPLAEEMSRVRQTRVHRAERMVEKLNADGVELDWAEILQIADGGTVGRPHLAQAMLRHGHVSAIAEAFSPQWLGERYYVAKQDIEVFTALRLVRAAGGVAVLAHSRRTDRMVPDSLIVQLANAGLFGIEADHPEHDAEARVQVRARAADLGLVVTGSSDFHGAVKTVQLAANITDQQVYDRIVAAATGNFPMTNKPLLEAAE